jgi:outer membrane protein TolC
MRNLAVLLVLAGTAHADPPARKVSFRDAIEMTLAQSPDIAQSKESEAAARARLSGTKSHRYATLSVDAIGQRWREPYAIMFGGGSFTLHEDLTSSTAVVVSQPLTGLGYVSLLVGASEHEASATHEEYNGARLDAAYKTAEAYIRVLEARAAADVAHRSVADIQSELDRAIQLRQADTYTDIDVLRFRSAKAVVDKQALQADTATQTSLARLVVQLGLRDGTPIDISDDLPTAPPTLALTLDRSIARAIDARPELKAARDRVAAADEQRKAAHHTYFPDVRAIAAWQHLTGVQPFQPEDEEYVGLRLSWNVWDWGATRDAVREAEANESRARIGADALADQVKLDVRQRWLEAKAAYDSIAEASTQQQTAEEALRLQKVRFEAGAATTTDVLDAETDAAKARLSLAIARYDYYLALFQLARAVGDLPETPQ